MRWYLWPVSVNASAQNWDAIVIPEVAVDASQAWFWMDGWQAAEVEASRQLADGAGVTYGNGEDFLADLP